MNLTLQVAIAVGALLALLDRSRHDQRRARARHAREPAADAGLAPGAHARQAARRALALAGRLRRSRCRTSGSSAAASASSATRCVTGAVVGTLLAVFLASLGVLISVFAGSNRVSLSLSLLVLLALFVPTQLPVERTAGLGRRPAPARQPDHRGRALRREDRHERARLEPRTSPGCSRRWCAAVVSRPRRSSSAPATSGSGEGRPDEAAAARVWSSRARARRRLLPGRGLRSRTTATAITTKLGHKFAFHSTIENRGATPARGLVAHLNVVDLTGHTYVDPEDWSSQRTRYLRPIPAGGSTTLTWPMNAVNAGRSGSTSRSCRAPARPSGRPPARLSASASTTGGR